MSQLVGLQVPAFEKYAPGWELLRGVSDKAVPITSSHHNYGTIYIEERIGHPYRVKMTLYNLSDKVKRQLTDCLRRKDDSVSVSHLVLRLGYAGRDVLNLGPRKIPLVKKLFPGFMSFYLTEASEYDVIGDRAFSLSGYEVYSMYLYDAYLNGKKSNLVTGQIVEDIRSIITCFRNAQSYNILLDYPDCYGNNKSFGKVKFNNEIFTNFIDCEKEAVQEISNQTLYSAIRTYIRLIDPDAPEPIVFTRGNKLFILRSFSNIDDTTKQIKLDYSSDLFSIRDKPLKTGKISLKMQGLGIQKLHIGMGVRVKTSTYVREPWLKTIARLSPFSPKDNTREFDILNKYLTKQEAISAIIKHTYDDDGFLTRCVLVEPGATFEDIESLLKTELSSPASKRARMRGVIDKKINTITYSYFGDISNTDASKYYAKIDYNLRDDVLLAEKVNTTKLQKNIKSIENLPIASPVLGTDGSNSFGLISPLHNNNRAIVVPLNNNRQHDCIVGFLKNSNTKIPNNNGEVLLFYGSSIIKVGPSSITLTDGNVTVSLSGGKVDIS